MLVRSVTAVLLLSLCVAVRCGADEPAPLHQQIDTRIATGFAGQSAPRADDAEFLRRVTLDLGGRIPTVAETREFLADSNPDKRTAAIDRLLAAPDYAIHMRDAFHVMLMERLGDHPEWAAFLQTSFAENKPYDQLVRELLHPNPDDEKTRGAAFWLTKRLENYGQNPVDVPALTRDVGRFFLGVDLQCAQCHDHLFVDDYKQQDFQGLFSFVAQTFIRQDVKFPAVGEKPVRTRTAFQSVFTKDPKETGPRLPGGSEVEIPTLSADEEFALPPDKAKKFPGVPRFSPLSILSEQLPRADNSQFVRTSVNRLWWLMLGRGLVHPLDLHHAGNPPSHPELLDLLAREFAEHKCDVKWLLREIALSETYQRASSLPEGTPAQPADRFAIAIEKPLSPEQLVAAILEATGETELLPAAIAAPGSRLARVPDEVKQKFLKAFANPPREPETDFAPSVRGTLFLMHDQTVQNWLKPRDANLAARLGRLTEPAPLAEELYLSILSRLPTAEETAGVTTYFAEQSGITVKSIEPLIWSLLASTEFAVNH